VVLILALGWWNPAGAQGQTPATFGTTVVIPSGLRGLIYYMREGEAWLPDFSRIRPVGVIYTTSLNVPPQDFSFGFPGVTSRYEWFAIDYRGRFWIDTPGDYQFSLTSDDGSILYIDEHSLINLDGMHQPQTQLQRIHLDCGIHHIRVSYFQGPRYQVALLLLISGGAKKKWRLFSTEEFKPPSNPEDWTCGGVRIPYDPNRRELPDAATLKKEIAFENEATAALTANPRPQDFPVWSAAYSFWRSAAGSQNSIAIGVPGTALTATRSTHGSPVNKLHAALYVVVKASDGREIDKFTIDTPFEFSDDAYTHIRTHDLVFSRPRHLPVGRYTIQTVVMDREGQRTGTSEIVVESPEEHAGIGLSSLVLVDRIEPAENSADAADPLVFEKTRVVPHLNPTIDPAAKLFIYFVVYPDSSNSAKPTVRVQFIGGTGQVAEQNAELPPPDASGAIPMFVQIAPQPGDAGLKVTVLQGENSASETLRYTVPRK